MKILYISSAASKKQFNYMQSKIKHNSYGHSIAGMPESSFKFHNSIINGLIENDCNVHSVIGRPISHKAYSKLFWPIVIEKNHNVVYNHMFILNLPLLKQFFCAIQLLFILIFWLIKNMFNSDKAIIIDASYVSLIPIINFVTRIVACRKIAIVADVYDYMSYTSNHDNMVSLKSKIIRNLIGYEYQRMNGFVFLTKEMSKLKPFKDKPYIVMEGIYDETNSHKEHTQKANYIMYAGAIKKEFGIERLIKAFMKYQNKNMELLIFGDGNYVKEMSNLIDKDKRIKYMGSVSLDEIQKYERDAILLVNPRQADKEFTKYSFPSKIIEYMASGTPVLTSKLSGIPNEYDDFLYYTENNTIGELTSKLSSILSQSKKILLSFGEKARNFIRKNKNSRVQSKNIISFLNSIKNEVEIPKEKLITIYILFNIIIILISLCNPFGLYAVSFRTYAIYICSVIFTVVGMRYHKKNDRNNEIIKDENKKNVVNHFLNSKGFTYFLIVELIMLLVYCIKYYYLVITAVDTNYRIIAFTSLYSNALSALFYKYIVSNISHIMIILLPILFFDKNLKHQCKLVNKILVFLIFVTQSLIGLGRMNFLLLIVSTGLVFLLFDDFRAIFKKRNILIFSLSLLVIFVVSCIGLSFRLFSNNFSINTLYSTVSYQIKQIFDYFVGSFRMLDIFLKNGFSEIGIMTFGRATLAGVDEIAVYALKVVTDDILSFNQIIGPMTQAEHAIGSSTLYYNAFYTSVLNYYLDFKIIGVIIFSLLHGLFISNIFKIYSKKTNFISKILVILVSYNSLMTVLKWEYQSGSSVFMLIILLLVIFYREIIDFCLKIIKKDKGEKI